MMNISMSDTVAMRVFETLDDNGQGTIDFGEFLMGIFPAHYLYLATVRRQSQEDLGGGSVVSRDAWSV